jgi:hypothetical protein
VRLDLALKPSICASHPASLQRCGQEGTVVTLLIYNLVGRMLTAFPLPSGQQQANKKKPHWEVGQFTTEEVRERKRERDSVPHLSACSIYASQYLACRVESRIAVSRKGRREIASECCESPKFLALIVEIVSGISRGSRNLPRDWEHAPYSAPERKGCTGKRSKPQICTQKVREHRRHDYLLSLNSLLLARLPSGGSL